MPPGPESCVKCYESATPVKFDEIPPEIAVPFRLRPQMQVLQIFIEKRSEVSKPLNLFIFFD